MENMSLSDIAAVTKDNDFKMDLDYSAFSVHVWQRMERQ